MRGFEAPAHGVYPQKIGVIEESTIVEVRPGPA